MPIARHLLLPTYPSILVLLVRDTWKIRDFKFLEGKTLFLQEKKKKLRDKKQLETGSYRGLRNTTTVTPSKTQFKFPFII